MLGATYPSVFVGISKVRREVAAVDLEDQEMIVTETWGLRADGRCESSAVSWVM